MIGFIKNWLANRRAIADRQRLILALESMLGSQGAVLVGLAKRQEELSEHQAVTIKAVVTNAGVAEMFAMNLATADQTERERLMEVVQKQIADFEPARKGLLDYIARMESESDARRCWIEQFEAELSARK